jgi:Ca2+-binding RTX toxin-like protein
MASNIQTWLDYALQQMAAESYLDQFLSGPRTLVKVLTNGNNNENIISDENAFRGATRFTNLLADRFIAKYDIVSHHANDSTGFSATLTQERGTSNFTLSFRSTEYRDQSEGGDFERDGLFTAPLTFAADGEIGADGFAFGQLAAMENYYLQLTTSGVLPTGATLNVTGYSLGSHLATIFTELHANDPDIVFGHTYTFNGAGRGHINGPGATEAARIDGMLDLLREVLFNPDAGLSIVVDALTNPRYLAAAGLAGQPFTPFTSETTLGGAGNIYTDARYRWAVEVATTVYDTDGTQTSPGEVGTSPAFAKITQLYGLATTGDLNVVANSGVHAPATPVFIEGQPQIEGVPFFQDQASFGNTHAITLLVDSLAVQELIQKIDSQYGQASAELLIKAASNTRAQNLAPLNTLDVVESDSLEKTVDAFRKLLRDPALPPASPLPVNSRVGGFGDLGNRNEMYAAIQEIKDRVGVLQAQQQGVAFTIDDLTNPTVSSPAIASIADTDTDQGIAYRYALKELNPFAVLANTPQANDALYQGHNTQGQLDRFNIADGTGAITSQYLTDRALYLKEKIALNQLDQETTTRTVHFLDVASNYEITTHISIFTTDRQFLFGSDDLDTLTGDSKGDHLYGGASVDVLIGNDGQDYLEGNGGSDRLEGGAGADTMVGGAGNDTYLVDDPGDQVIEVGDNGNDTVESSVTFSLVGTTVEDLTLTGANDLDGTGNELNNTITGNGGINRLDGKGGTDHLIGGIGNDVLAGGTGDNDLLEGGAGFDTYIYTAGDGIDRIEDSDARGKIVFNGGLLQGGISTDGGATYVSLDGTETYVLSGGHLIVNGVITVNENFQSGQFGIHLDDLSDFPTNTGVPAGPFQVVLTGSEGPDALGPGGLPGPGNAVFGLGGNDRLAGIDLGVDLLDGGAGDDILTSLSGDDYLDGGPGNDYLRQGDGNGVLLGGTGDDVLVASEELFLVPSDRDYLDGGDGADYLWGGKGTDVLLGGNGDDTLRGDNLPDGWPALHPEFGTPVPGSAIFSATGAADFLDGGSGNDLLVGDSGDDILSGGAGNDQLFGDDEAGYWVVPGDDVLDGGMGDDLLAAGDGADSLSGGVGLDQLFADKGNDVLDGGDDLDTLHGGDGADELFGGGGDDLLFGDGLNNPSNLSAAGGADFLDGGDGNDHLEGGIGDDAVFAGTGNDMLFGDEGADSLFGDDGNDELQGGDGIDLLGGDAGDDRLFGQADNDTLIGDAGNDTLAGNDGNDSLYGGVGNDILEGGKGSDVLVGGAGHDTYNFSLGDGQDTITDTALAGEGNVIQFFSGITLQSLTFIQDQAQQTLTIQVGAGDSIRLLGFDPNTFNYVVDTLDFADGTVVALADQLPLPGGLIEGTENNNVIRTGSSDDTIFAGAGNDVVNAGAGNDVILGEGGNDFLAGGPGQDSYVFTAGDGTDTISDTAGEGNRLVFGTGMTSSSITLGLAPGNALEIRGQLPDDRLEVGALVPGASPIETVQFADGTVLTFDQFIARGIDIAGTSGPDTITGTSFIDRISAGGGDDVVQGGDDNDVLNGEAGNDNLEGEVGNDVLAGRAGDDQLLGGEGNDTYQFNLGDGIDSISDSIDVAEPNRVVFGSGITSSSITLTTDFGQVLVRPGSAFEGVTIGANGSDVLGFHAVDLFQFEDGTSLTYADLVARGFDLDGTEFDDFLFGTNVVDRFRGGLGNDWLEGGEGNDSYFFNLDDGVDTIIDTAMQGAGNEVVFGSGIASTDLRLDLAPDQSDSNLSDLLIRVGAGGGAVQLDTFDHNNVLGPRTVETFQFADGSTLTYDQLLPRGFDLTGTDGDEQLSGTNVADRIVADDGADVLRSGLGNDTLDGGLGNDRLFGGQGNDTYIFGLGSGQDSIIESLGSLDTIRMAPGVAPSDVVATQINDDLVLSLNGGADRLTVSLYFLASPLQIELVQFADGTVWDQAFIGNLLQPTITGTGGQDVLVGTSSNDRLAGLAGDDQVAGLAGNDLLDGGTGADQLTGGAGDDTYIVDDVGDVVTELVNEGIDTLQSSMTRTLDANVERLILTGTAVVDGTGNALDNVLTGNSAANVLTGGHGNDTYVVGAGDHVAELVGEGIDTVQSDMSYVLVTNIEYLTLIGNQIVNGVGNDLDNVLSGNGAPNVLSGGLGNEKYLVEADDTVVELTGEGIDSIETTGSYHLGTNLENLVLRDEGLSANVSGLVLTGNELANVVTGNRYANVLDGGIGADELIGGGGDDTYIVDHAGDTVVEGLSAGVDTIGSSVDFTLGANVEVLALSGELAQRGTGNELDNTLYGNQTDNILDGGAGNDFLAGSLGQDTYLFGHGSGRDTVQDTVFGEVNTILMAPDISPSDVVVTTGYPNSFVSLVIRIVSTGDEITIPDFFQSTAHQQTKAVQFANGTVWGGNTLASLSTLYPRLILSGNALDNTLSGGVGDDEIGGNLGNDLLFGEAGNDLLQGGQGGDLLSGGLGNDRLYGESFFFNGIPLDANDTLLGDAGDDTLSGDYGNDILDGGTGDDTLAGGDGNDQLNGGPGNDWLDGGPGGDVYVFGRGSGWDFAYGDSEDFIRLTSNVAPSDVTITRSGIVMYLRINGTQDEIGAYLDPNDPSLRIGQVEFSNGTIWNQATLFQKALSIVGTSGPDFLEGTSLQETLSGEQGDDTYYRFAPQDTIIEAPGEGIDTVVALNGVTLPANVENLTLYEDGTLVGGAERGTGNALNNILIGNHADNVLDGGAGNDTLIGGSIFIPEQGGALGDGSDILIGGEGDDFLQAYGGRNGFIPSVEIPLSVYGEDLLIGGTGNDTYVVFPANESIVERVGEGTDTVMAGNDYTLGQNLENLTLMGGSSGTGNELSNLLIGNSADNVLVGEAGDDTLWGGNGLNPDDLGVMISGNDTLIGGTGNDTYLFKVGDGIDTVDDATVAGEGNRIQFGVGIVQSDLTFTHDQIMRALTIQVGSSGADQLVLTNFDPTNANGSLATETLAFADGSTTSLAALLGGSVNHAPTVATPLAAQTVPEDAPFSVVMPANTFADEDEGDVLTLSASLADGSALPAWLNFDAATATFSGTPDDAQVGTLDLRVTATDHGTLSVSDTFTLNVTNVNEAPTVAVLLADQQAVEDAPFSLVVPVGTFADVDAGDTLTYSATLDNGANLPTWLSFDPITRTFSGTPLNDDVGTLAVTVTATDTGALSASDTFSLAVTNVNDAPTVANPIVDQSAQQGAAFAFTVPTNTFADVDPGDQLTYGATLADGSALPAWLTFDAATATFSGTPSSGDAGLVSLTVTATDSGSLSVSDVFALTVTIQDQILTGTAGSDVLTGGVGNDQLFGLAGNDTLQGGAGNDLLDGGAGTDTMQGGTGNDTYVVDVTGDVVTENVNEGVDTVQSNVTWTLGANVENLTLTGTAAISGTGNALDNIITGNGANNTLSGGAGNDRLDGALGSDTMIGGTGDDTYVVNQAGDAITESLNQGTDTVESAITFTLGSNVENLLLTGTGNINGTGSSANNVLVGNSGNNTLNSGSGNDTVDGGAGNDSLLGGSGDDQLLGGVGDDTLNAGSGNDVLNSGDGTDILDGGSSDDQLLGGAGNDALTGGSGADQFTGGTGNDTLTGGSGNDLYNFSRGDGQDTISDSAPISGNQDRALFGTTINPLDLVISRQTNDLRLAIHGSSDRITVQNWYVGTTNRIETLQAGNGQTLLSTQVDQLIQAMAGFTQQTGLTWDQAIDQRPQDVETVLAGSWQ